MPKPYKFRYVNQIAGAFAGLILLILVVGLVLVARAQKWFEPVRHITIRMPSEGCYGLKAGGDVRIMGAVVGAIDNIEIQPKTGLMVAAVHVRPDFAEFIRLGTADVKAIIHVPIGFADPYLEILNAKAFATEATPVGLIIAEHEADASEAFNRIGKYVDAVGPAVDKLLREYTQLAADLRSPDGPVQQALTRINAAAAKLEQNDNMAGRLLNDKRIADQLDQTVSHIAASSAQIEATVADLRKAAADQSRRLPEMVEKTNAIMLEMQQALHDVQTATSQLPAIMGSVRETLDSMPGLLAHTQQSLIELQRLIRGVQELPFIRDNIDHTAAETTLRPTAIGGPP